MKTPRQRRMVRLTTVLIFLCLFLCPLAGARAAAPIPGAPLRPVEMEAAKTSELFKEPLRRSAPFIDTEEVPLQPARGFTRGVPPGFAPPTAPEPKSPQAPELPVSALRNTSPPRKSVRLSSGFAPISAKKPGISPASSLAGLTAVSPSASEDAPLSEMLGQMLLVGFSGFDLPENSPLDVSIKAGRVGGVILFERSPAGTPKNIDSPTQLRLLVARLQKSAPRPLFIAVDQEGGRVQRLRPERGFEGGPAAAALGLKTPDNTRLIARRMGLEMAALGINLDLAPVADINSNPLSPAIGGLQRSFGADPLQTASHVSAFAEGLAAAGVAPCLKHFPGHGSAGADSHDSLPDISASWRPEELTPYREVLRANLPVAVMPGHLFHRGLDALYPASLSPRVLNGLLRGKLGFRGVIITDDLQMDAAARVYSLEERVLRAVEAGADILIFSNNTRAPEVTADELHAVLLNFVRQGRISEQRVALSFERIRRLKQRFAGWKS